MPRLSQVNHSPWQGAVESIGPLRLPASGRCLLIALGAGVPLWSKPPQRAGDVGWLIKAGFFGLRAAEYATRSRPAT